MDGDYDDRALITNWHKAITSRDIDALVQLKLLTKAL